ncbi:uncharacterized protein LOC142487199 [Ascaphus truei]|uniref:uncharacterized protein LOC142487199 n=1 Tax=Ascaphus truei TaxID=8439 RepID=UPI003F5A7C55
MFSQFLKKDLPSGARDSVTLVTEREGKKYTKKCKLLFKLLDLPPTGRLQPKLLRTNMQMCKGKLKDAGMWENAEKFLSVAIDLQKEGYEEIECGERDKKCYCYVKPENVTPGSVVAEKDQMLQGNPPPYPQTTGRPSPSAPVPAPYWVCSVCQCQNPKTWENCYYCGAARPSMSPDIKTGEALVCPLVTPTGQYFNPKAKPADPVKMYPSIPQDCLVQMDNGAPAEEDATSAGTPAYQAPPYSDSFVTYDEPESLFERVFSGPTRQIIVKVMQADITSLSVGAIVNPANGRLQHNGGLAKLICEKGGEAIQRDSNTYIQKHGEVSVGGIAATGPGDLPCNLIIHAAGPVYRDYAPERAKQLLQAVVRTSLIYASGLNSAAMPRRTIAFPPISGGLFGYPIKECVKHIVQAVLSTIKESPLNLESILLVANDSVRPLLFQAACATSDTVRSFPIVKAEHGNAPPVPQPWNEDVPEGAVRYIKFTPQQSSTLLQQLPDPEDKPMPFYRMLRQIQQNYSATWADLKSLTMLKAGDSFWPLVEKSLNDARIVDVTDYKSGEDFLEQIQLWAQDRLTEQTESIKDVTQEATESVEKYHTRLLQMFRDMGFSTSNKLQANLLAAAFMDGLTPKLRAAVQEGCPWMTSLGYTEALTIAKAFQKKQSSVKKTPAAIQEEKEDDRIGVLYTASSQVPMLPPRQLYPPAPQYQEYQGNQGYQQYQDNYTATPPYQGNQGYQNGRAADQQRPRGPCYHCGRIGHIKRNCRDYLKGTPPVQPLQAQQPPFWRSQPPSNWQQPQQPLQPQQAQIQQRLPSPRPYPHDTYPPPQDPPPQ